jgi:hypothetical protein
MAFVHYGVSPTNVVLRIKLMNRKSMEGDGLTGVSNTSTGLIISTIKINESTPVTYQSSDSTIDSITTLGVYQVPTAGHCRFRELDPTNNPGIYEVQFENSRFQNTDSFLLSLSGAYHLAEFDGVVQCKNLAADMEQIQGADVNTDEAQVGVNVVSQNNIDFGTLQKESIDEIITNNEQIQEIHTAVMAGEGIYSVTLHLQTSPGAPINDASIQIFDQSELTLQAVGESDVDGNKVFALDAGTYHILISKQGTYSFTVPEVITVTGNATFTFVGTPVPIVPPTANCQLVYLYPIDISSVISTCDEITITPSSDIQNPYILVRNKVKMQYIAARGRYEANIIKQSEVTVDGWSKGRQFIYGTGIIDTDATKNLVDYEWITSQ